MQKLLPKVESSFTFDAPCLATILAVAGYVTLYDVSCKLVSGNAVTKIGRQVVHDIAKCDNALSS